MEAIVVAFVVVLVLVLTGYAVVHVYRRDHESATNVRATDFRTPGFEVVEWVRPTRPDTHVTRPGGPPSGDFVAIPEKNMTARCYLTGTEVGSCTCNKHRGMR